MTQIAFNLYDGLCCTIHARSGVHSPYNLLDCPPRFRQTAFAVVLPRAEGSAGANTETRCER